MPSKAIAENKYWLQTMGDHAMIIHDALSPNETEEIQTARGLIAQFDGLLQAARSNISDDQSKELNRRALKAAQDIRRYILHILTRQLTDHIELIFSSALLNHMLNEIDEYIYILNMYQNDMPVNFHPLHLHLVYLLDALGHTTIIQNYVSFPFRDVREEAARYEHDFMILYNKAVEYTGYLRTDLKDFKALDQLNNDIYEKLRVFAEFSVDLMLKIRERSVLGPLNVLFLDHMYREECYYLMQLSSVTKSPRPVCDPATPRMTE